MTIDELMRIYSDAACAGSTFPQYETPDHRAGIVAVVRALRDDLQFWENDCHACDRASGTFREILGSDAGSEKVAGGCADGTVVQRQRYGENDRQSKDGAEVSPRHPDPATDLCPRCGYPAQDQCDSPDCNTVPAPSAGTSEWKGIMFVETAPAVCEWTPQDEGPAHEIWKTGCGTMYERAKSTGWCNKCKAPIKFTEAKT